MTKCHRKQPLKVQEWVEDATMFLCKHRLKETEGNKSVRTSEYVDKEKRSGEKKRQFCTWESVTKGTENANNDRPWNKQQKQ